MHKNKSKKGKGNEMPFPWWSPNYCHGLDHSTKDGQKKKTKKRRGTGVALIEWHKIFVQIYDHLKDVKLHVLSLIFVL